jgi:hypothetical protein
MSTSARAIELLTHPARTAYRGVDRPRGHIDLIIDHGFAGSEPLDGGDLIEIDLQTGAAEFTRVRCT